MLLLTPVPLAVAVPFVAADEMLHVSGFPSTSVALSVRLNGVGLPSSLMVTEVDAPSVMIGASLTAVIVTFTVMSSIPPNPSLTRTVKESEPL